MSGEIPIDPKELGLTTETETHGFIETDLKRAEEAGVSVGKERRITEQESAKFAGLAGISKESTIPISPEKIHLDDEFSSVEANLSSAEIAEIYAQQITDGGFDAEKGQLLLATIRSGRSGFSEPTVILETADGTRRTASVFIKSIGVPLAVRERWAAYKGKNTPFFYFQPKHPQGDIQEDLTREEAFLGVAIKKDQKLDAERSVMLHDFGVKVRIPLAGWNVDSFTVGGEERDIDWFKEQGWYGDELYQSAWGMSCPLRLEDVNDYLIEAMPNEIAIDGEAIDQLLIALLDLAQTDKSQEYQELYEKWQERVATGHEFTNNERADLLEDFGIALCKTMGWNYGVMYQNNLQHGNLHSQNISFFGELCDNSTVGEGLLEIGLAPENSADIDGFRQALFNLSSDITKLRGINPIYDTAKVYSHRETVFFETVKESWPSYEKFCKARNEADIDKAVEGMGWYYRESLANEYREEEITEEMVRGVALKKLGGFNRPFD